jgi:hypothetical protein
METENDRRTRIRARDAAARTLNRITTGVVFGAVACVGLIGAVSAITIPGIAAYSSGATAGTTTSSGTTSTGLQSSSGGVSSSSGSGVVVSGGS